MKQSQAKKNWHLVNKVCVSRNLCPPEGAQSPSHGTDHHKNLFDLMKPLILFARLIALIPRGKPKATTLNKRFYTRKLSIIPSVMMAVWLLFKITVLIYALFTSQTNGFMKYILDSNPVVNDCFKLFTYTYFLMKIDKFYKLFEYWSQLADAGVISSDPKLKYWAYFLFVGIIVPMVSYLCGIPHSLNQAFAKNAKWNTNPHSVMEAFFDEYMKPFHILMSYSPIVTIMYGVLYEIEYLSYLFIPVMITFLSRSVSFQFKHLVESACNSTSDEVHRIDMKHKGKEFWNNLVYKYNNLFNILKTMNNFMSPILFWWTVLGIYNISTLLFQSLSKVQKIQVPSSLYTLGFALDVIPFVTTLIFAAMVNKNASKMIMLLRNCPKEDFHDTEVCRLEHQISTAGQNIGFSGLGCFVVTKPFLLTVFNAIFTLEIFMLQSE